MAWIRAIRCRIRDVEHHNLGDVSLDGARSTARTGVQGAARHGPDRVLCADRFLPPVPRHLQYRSRR